MINTLNENKQPINALAENIEALNFRNSEGLLIGIIKTLDPDLQQQTFKQPGQQVKIDFLENNLNVSEQVRAKLSEVKNILQIEDRIQRLMELSIVLQTEPGKWLMDEDAIRKISTLSESNLNLMLDYAHYLKPRFDAVNLQIKNIKHDLAVKTAILDIITKSVKARMQPTQISIVQVAKRTLHLIELRPAVADFRGCLGGDCSTKYSFAAPNNTDELVFELTNDMKESKGYVEATRVIVNGKPTLYVSSINGPRISAADIELNFKRSI
jgi:hypothetical protein